MSQLCSDRAGTARELLFSQPPIMAVCQGHAGASLGKIGLAVAINEMLKRRSVAEWLRRGPVAGREMRVADEEQFDLGARLVEPAQLGKACRQETA